MPARGGPLEEGQQLGVESVDQFPELLNGSALNRADGLKAFQWCPGAHHVEVGPSQRIESFTDVGGWTRECCRECGDLVRWRDEVELADPLTGEPGVGRDVEWLRTEGPRRSSPERGGEWGT